MEHLTSYHTKRTQYVCRGAKQIKMILALHDSDRLEGAPAGLRLKLIQGAREIL